MYILVTATRCAFGGGGLLSIAMLLWFWLGEANGDDGMDEVLQARGG